MICEDDIKMGIERIVYYMPLQPSTTFYLNTHDTKMPRGYTAAEALALLQTVDACDSDGGEESLLLEESSNSDLSSNEEMCSGSKSKTPPKKKGRLETKTGPNSNCQVAKDGTVWVEEEVGRPLPHNHLEPYPRDGEPTTEVRRSVKTRLQSFLCLVSWDILHTIRNCTVEHGRQMEIGWNMSVYELLAFISILLWRGVIRTPSLADAWSATLGISHVKNIMPRNHFQDIMRHLRFDDKDTRPQRLETDKFAAVFEVWRKLFPTASSPTTQAGTSLSMSSFFQQRLAVLSNSISLQNLTSLELSSGLPVI